MGNGLIFAFVVALWAAYFVPLAVRRYDEASKSGSIDKFTSLSRVIPQRSERLADEPVAEEPVVRAPAAPAAPDSKADVAPVRASTRLAARRRRRTLITLLTLAVATGAVAGFGYIPLWSIAIPAVLIIAWLIACRIQVRGELGIGKPRVKTPRIKTPRVKAAKGKTKKAKAATAAEEEATVVVSYQYEDIEPHRKRVMEKVELEAGALDEQLVIAAPVSSTTGEVLWDPLPVTLPTYVTKPRAGRTVRTIEFGEPGAWTSGHIEGEDVELPKRKDAGEDEPRRAVGH